MMTRCGFSPFLMFEMNDLAAPTVLFYLACTGEARVDHRDRPRILVGR